MNRHWGTLCRLGLACALAGAGCGGLTLERADSGVTDASDGSVGAADAGDEHDSTGVAADGPSGDVSASNDGAIDATTPDVAAPGEAAVDAAIDASDASAIVGSPRLLAAGNGHTCAVVDGGGVRCWGSNGSGQVGVALDAGSVASPVDVVGIQSAVEVTAGSAHTCARLSDGTVRCWGDGDCLGDNYGATSTVPVVVSGLTNAVQLVAGNFHTCALRADHHVVCWGVNQYGPIGDGTTTERLVPTEPVGPITDAVAVGASYQDTCVVHANGSITCSGDNSWDQLGDGTQNNSLVPVQVLNVSNAEFVGLASVNSCAVLQDGSVSCWGANDRGELGIGSQDGYPHEATAVTGIAGVAEISGGDLGTCAVTTAQVPYCWGEPTSVNPWTLSPSVVTGLGATIELAAGAAHVCARLASGQVACWGDNSSGQLGSPDAGASSTTPVIVQGL